METLMILTYAAICVAVFKIFKIPLTKWTVPTAVLGGIILLASVITLMNYNHPYSEATRGYFVSTPIISAVRGRVISVDVEPNTPIKKGQLLFSIDPTPFQSKVDSLTAKLVSAKLDYERSIELLKRNVGKQRDVDMTKATMEDLIGQLGEAQYKLENTKVRSESDGYVTQMFVYPGLYVVPLPLFASMIFVENSSFTYVGWYRQNNAIRLKVGFEAEIAFDALPGKVFTGEVSKVLPVIAEGQLKPSENMVTIDKAGYSPGRIPVEIKITDPRFVELAKYVPGGSYGQSAIYSNSVEHVAIIRRIILRMSSWLSYLFPFH